MGEVLNTDAETYGGSNLGNFGGQHAEPQAGRASRTLSCSACRRFRRGI
jgi:hypothetical protein